MSKLVIMLTLSGLLLVTWGWQSTQTAAAPQDTAISTLEFLTDRTPSLGPLIALQHIQEAITRRPSGSSSLALPAEGLFDGVTVDIATVTVGGAAPATVELVDLNGDGSSDLSLSFDAALIDSSGSAQVCAQGETTEGVPVEVCGDMQVAP